MPAKHIRTFRSKKLHPEHAKLINEAIRKNARGGDHNVHISYTKADGTKSDRKVKPLAVKGKSLFVAHCHERNAIRSFKVERIDMIKKAFWDGFEKRAYNYDYETKELGKYYVGRSKNKPASKLKSSLIGAGVGGALGAGYGAAHSAGTGALIGGGIGALGGGFLGLLGAISDKLGIEEAKRIMKMPEGEREEYLRHLTRQNEISEKDAEEWSRDFHRDLREERRHKETLNAMHRRY